MFNPILTTLSGHLEKNPDLVQISDQIKIDSQYLLLSLQARLYNSIGKLGLYFALHGYFSFEEMGKSEAEEKAKELYPQTLFSQVLIPKIGQVTASLAKLGSLI